MLIRDGELSRVHAEPPPKTQQQTNRHDDWIYAVQPAEFDMGKKKKPLSSGKKTKRATKAAAAIASNLDGLAAVVPPGAIKAVSQLIGGVVAIPVAGLRRVSQRIEDRTDANSLLSRAIATAAANQAINDPELVDRALQSLLNDTLGKQRKRENVARAAVEALRDERADNDAAEEVDEDWMSSFVRFAEQASSERTQQLWGRILAGEIRKPGAFSLSTMRFLAELDKPLAEDFEAFVKHLVGDVVFQTPARSGGELFGQMLRLQECGLINGADGMISRTYVIPPQGPLYVVGVRFALMIEGDANANIVPGAIALTSIIPLTRIGRELRQLLPPAEFERDELFSFATTLNKAVCKKISIGRINAGRLVDVEQLHPDADAGETSA